MRQLARTLPGGAAGRDRGHRYRRPRRRRLGWPHGRHRQDVPPRAASGCARARRGHAGDSRFTTRQSLPASPSARSAPTLMLRRPGAASSLLDIEPYATLADEHPGRRVFGEVVIGAADRYVRLASAASEPVACEPRHRAIIPALSDILPPRRRATPAHRSPHFFERIDSCGGWPGSLQLGRSSVNSCKTPKGGREYGIARPKRTEEPQEVASSTCSLGSYSGGPWSEAAPLAGRRLATPLATRS